MGDERGQYVIHLPVLAANLDSARRFARAVGRSLTFLPEIDAIETTVSEADRQNVRYRAYCDRVPDGPYRCLLAATHDGRCVPEFQAGPEL
jgi:hypothetical protein